MSDNARPVILLTRPEAASERFAAACRAAIGDAAEIVIAPLMEIVALPDPVDLGDATALVFTSEAGVVSFADTSDRRDLAAYCVGDRTAEAARLTGLTATSAQGSADDLVSLISSNPPQGRVVHLHGRHTRGDVVGRLLALGVAAEGREVYDQRPVALSPDARALMTSPTTVVAPLFSPRSADLFAKAVGADPHPKKSCIAMSDAVCAALPPNWQAQTCVAAHPDGPSMIAALAEAISP